MNDLSHVRFTHELMVECPGNIRPVHATAGVQVSSGPPHPTGGVSLSAEQFHAFSSSSHIRHAIEEGSHRHIREALQEYEQDRIKFRELQVSFVELMQQTNIWFEKMSGNMRFIENELTSTGEELAAHEKHLAKSATVSRADQMLKAEVERVLDGSLPWQEFTDRAYTILVSMHILFLDDYV